jgi:Putative beta-barrel porin-2, OmpL-like. bbp2
VGALLSYSPTEWLSLTAGPVVGWDVANDNNDAMSVLGQLAFTGIKDLTTSLNFITGPEQFDQKGNPRTVLDLVVNYTGIKNLILGVNVDYGWEVDEPSLVSTRSSSTTAVWYGVAGYVAYDWTEKLRTALRGEYFRDADGARTLAVGPGSPVSLWEITATVQLQDLAGTRRPAGVPARPGRRESVQDPHARPGADGQEPGHDHRGPVLLVLLIRDSTVDPA